MREPSPWAPRLAATGRSTSERLAAALAEDLVDGRVPAGARLPAHRALARELGIAVGTVTKAYAALERRGLVRGTHGQGTFAAYRASTPEDRIDLSTNMPPPLLGDAAIGAALDAVRRRVDAGGLADYGPPGGHARHRRIVADWIAGTGLELPAEELLLCNGAQHAIAAAFLAASAGTSPAAVFTEAVAFPGALAYARLAGHALHGIPMDEEGLVPAALDRALAEHARTRAAGAPRPIVSVTPTLQNPTAATMGGRRRRELVRVARRNDALIVEDDVYSLDGERAAPALRSLAPERTFYLTSASKAVSPALRIGALLPPAALRERSIAAVRALGQPVSPIQAELLGELARAGVAEEVRDAVRREGRRRNALARDVLGERMLHRDDRAYHGFVPLPRRDAEATVLAAAAAGVRLSEPAAHTTDPGGAQSGIRLCLGAVPADELARALAVVVDALDGLGEPAGLGERPAAAVR